MQTPEQKALLREIVWTALAIIAALFVSVIVAVAVAQPAAAAVAEPSVPTAALKHRADLTRNARAVMGLRAPVATLAAQVHQESAWRPGAVSRVGAAGLAQFMPTTSAWIAQLVPELAANEPFNPTWSLRALVHYDAWLYERVDAVDGCERWAMTLSAYNGGLRWIERDQLLATRQGLDPHVWFGSVETVNSGRSSANWRENRDYPHRILVQLEPLYVAAGWGLGVCA